MDHLQDNTVAEDLDCVSLLDVPGINRDKACP